MLKSLRLIVCFLLGFFCFNLYAEVIPNNYESQVAAYETWDRQNRLPSSPIVFVGSSTIRKWRNISEDLESQKVLGRGVGGAIVEDLIHFQERIIIKYRPAKLFIYIGDNDITSSLTNEVILNKIQKFILDLKTKIPATKIYFISIKPSPSRAHLLAKGQWINQKMNEWTRSQNNMIYVDVASAMMLPNNRIRPDLFERDRLHMNSKGYVIWSQILKPLVEGR